jgi:hypothetical protein
MCLIRTFPEINTEALQPGISFCKRSLVWYWARSTSYRQPYCWLLQTFHVSTKEDSIYSFETIVWNFTTYDLWISERTNCYIMTVKPLIASMEYFVTLSSQTWLWNRQSHLWVRVCACVRACDRELPWYWFYSLTDFKQKYLTSFIMVVVNKTGNKLLPLACWDCGFEYCQGHGCLPLYIVVCFQVEL